MLRNPHDTHHTACQHLRLADSGVGEICFCPDCGVVHVALQYFTMRFEIEAFTALQTMLSEAQHKIAQHVRTQPTAGDPFATVNADDSPKTIVH